MRIYKERLAKSVSLTLISESCYLPYCYSLDMTLEGKKQSDHVFIQPFRPDKNKSIGDLAMYATGKTHPDIKLQKVPPGF